LPVGAEIGEYRIVESGAVDARGPFYVAEPKDAAAHPEEAAPGLRYIVRELTDGASDQLAHIVTMGLRHPVLLTPVALAREDGRLFLVSMEIADEHGVRVPPMSVGERLRPVDALRRGAEVVQTRWWRTFGVLLAFGVVVGALGALGGALAHAIANGALFTTAWILVQTVTLSLSAIFGTLLFFDLRARTALPWQGTPPV